jgi:acetyl-CoA carboxylase biotin carboxylase subunit
MGNKTAARTAMQDAGVPIIPGTTDPVGSVDELLALGDELGFPLLIKAAAGGGGKGMEEVHDPAQAEQAFERARRQGQSYFANPDVYVEKLIVDPRHVEVQVLADSHGNVVHLGERDCSMQRRHQKVVEEAPAPGISAAQREQIGKVCVEACVRIGYRGAGTFEFLFENGKFYFIEMNTRIQVEHPVTEMITDIDLIFEQIRVAAGSELAIRQSDVKFHGHAIECRINAENPVSFRPSPGKILHYHAPGGLGVRIDSAVYQGYTIPPYYDSLVGKLIVHGKTRTECLMRLKRALDEVVVDGIETTLPLFRALVRENDIIDGNYHIHWLEQFLARGGMES